MGDEADGDLKNLSTDILPTLPTHGGIFPQSRYNYFVTPPQADLYDLRAQWELARRRLARRKLIYFTLATYPLYEVNWHHELIAAALEDVEAGRTDRLMIFTAPRHGKSELVSVRFPAWYLGRNPRNEIISTSYNEDLAVDFGGKTRDILLSDEWVKIFPAVGISGSAYAKGKWGVEILTEIGPYGGYRAAGVGGTISGRGADVLIIDDPIKNIEEAESQLQRDKVWDWYKSTAYTRLEKGGAVILVLTRWHKDDLAGRLLQSQEQEGDKWRIIDLPAIARQNEIHRNEGEALWPGKYDIAALARIKEAIGSRFWQALYQQQPTFEEGNIFKSKWWQYADTMIGMPWVTLHSYDTAWEDTDNAKYTCCQHWTRTDHGYYIKSSRRRKIQYPEIKQWMLELYLLERPDGILLERKASGIAAIQELQRGVELDQYPELTEKMKNVYGIEIKPRTIVNLPIIPWPREGEAMGSKLVRALSQAPVVEAGLVHIMGHPGETWVDEFVQECADFPNGMYNDQVDAAGQAIDYIKDGAGIGVAMAMGGVSFGVGVSSYLGGNTE